MRIVLASQSPARRATLVSAGITPIVFVSHVDEDAVLAALPGGRAFSGGATTPADEVGSLARAKCEAVAREIAAGSVEIPKNLGPDAAGTPGIDRLVVLGCDSMLELDGRMLGKPHSPEVARQRIRDMRGHDATLWTGHHVVVLEHQPQIGDGLETPASWSAVASLGAAGSTLVRFGQISGAEIDAYVDSGEPLEVAGSFTVDGLGGPFVTGIDGDYHSVVGLSLPLLRQMLTGLGLFWPDLWDRRREERPL